MVTKKIKENIFSVGVNDWDRELFDELIPLPDGTSYNSYLIKGMDKVALIDTVDPTKTCELLDNLKNLNVDKIDYVIANHAEQDHSGSIPEILKNYPSALVVTNAKCKEMLKDHLHVADEKIIVIEDGKTLSLGNKTLEFIFAPWVHWPETMFTYLREDKILFTCDFLGSHLATSDLYATDESKVYESAKRYYAEIMMPFRGNIKRHLEKISELSIDIIAPSHGSSYKNIEFILKAYTEWVSDEVKNEVLIPYISMHDSTKIAVNYLVDRLVEKNIYVKPFNLVRTDLGKLAISLVDAATLVLASPTVLTGPHPQVMYAATLIGALRPKTKFLGIITSFGWAGKSVEVLESLLGNLKAERLEAVNIKGLPRDVDFEALKRLVDEIEGKHKALNLS